MRITAAAFGLTVMLVGLVPGAAAEEVDPYVAAKRAAGPARPPRPGARAVFSPARLHRDGRDGLIRPKRC